MLGDPHEPSPLRAPRCCDTPNPVLEPPNGCMGQAICRMLRCEPREFYAYSSRCQNPHPKEPTSVGVNSENSQRECKHTQNHSDDCSPARSFAPHKAYDSKGEPEQTQNRTAKHLVIMLPQTWVAPESPHSRCPRSNVVDEDHTATPIQPCPNAEANCGNDAKHGLPMVQRFQTRFSHDSLRLTTEQRGRPSASALTTDVARPCSLQ
jgi:hypothetical protein